MSEFLYRNSLGIIPIQDIKHVCYKLKIYLVSSLK
jgi:hypothetical protein